MAREKYGPEYFKKWYRDPATRVSTPASAARKAFLAVGLAEYYLGRPIRNVLDLGCGEGQWYPILKKLRPRLKYTGVDPSRYAIERFGRRRNLLLGSFGDLPPLENSYDLMVCSDILYYVPEDELIMGLEQLVPRLAGVAFFEAYASDETLEGDTTSMLPRPASFYRRIFRHAGLIPCGSHGYVAPCIADRVTELERGR